MPIYQVYCDAISDDKQRVSSKFDATREPWVKTKKESVKIT